MGTVMGQVSVNLNGRSYLLECGEGEEQHLIALAGTIGEQIERVKSQFGQIGDDRLMLMAGLMVADELSDTRSKLEEVNARLDDFRKDRASVNELVQTAEDRMAATMQAAAERLEALNEVLVQGAEAEDDPG